MRDDRAPMCSGGPEARGHSAQCVALVTLPLASVLSSLLSYAMYVCVCYTYAHADPLSSLLIMNYVTIFFFWLWVLPVSVPREPCGFADFSVVFIFKILYYMFRSTLFMSDNWRLLWERVCCDWEVTSYVAALAHIIIVVIVTKIAKYQL